MIPSSLRGTKDLGFLQLSKIGRRKKSYIIWVARCGGSSQFGQHALGSYRNGVLRDEGFGASRAELGEGQAWPQPSWQGTLGCSPGEGEIRGLRVQVPHLPGCPIGPRTPLGLKAGIGERKKEN